MIQLCCFPSLTTCFCPVYSQVLPSTLLPRHVLSPITGVHPPLSLGFLVTHPFPKSCLHASVLAALHFSVTSDFFDSFASWCPLVSFHVHRVPATCLSRWPIPPPHRPSIGFTLPGEASWQTVVEIQDYRAEGWARMALEGKGGHGRHFKEKLWLHDSMDAGRKGGWWSKQVSQGSSLWNWNNDVRKVRKRCWF